MTALIKWLVMPVVIGLLALVAVVYFFFGRGTPYPDLTTEPLLGPDDLEIAVTSDRPIGNAAVSADGRIFYTIHPEARLPSPKLYEWIDGQAVPYPNAADQDALFHTPLGLAIDRQNRLWVIDPANHGLGSPRLLAFDLATGEVVHDHRFPRDVAPRGSFLQDLQISSDGTWIYIADVGFWMKRPALIVYNTETQTGRRVLNRHETVFPQNILIQTPIRDMSFFGGILEMKTGVDGVALSRDDQWLYFAAMNHDTLYRIPTELLHQDNLHHALLAVDIESVARKPLSDGLSIDDALNVYVTDIEHGAVIRVDEEGTAETVIKDERIRWADGLSFGPDGWLYLADSAIPHLVLQSPEHIAAQAPFYIWRFKPGGTAPAGQ